MSSNAEDQESSKTFKGPVIALGLSAVVWIAAALCLLRYLGKGA